VDISAEGIEYSVSIAHYATVDYTDGVTADLPGVASALLSPTNPLPASELLSFEISPPDYRQLIDDYAVWLDELPVGAPLLPESYRDDGAVELGRQWLHSDILAAYGSQIEASMVHLH
jgi:hypothetical protein